MVEEHAWECPDVVAVQNGKGLDRPFPVQCLENGYIDSGFEVHFETDARMDMIDATRHAPPMASIGFKFDDSRIKTKLEQRGQNGILEFLRKQADTLLKTQELGLREQAFY